MRSRPLTVLCHPRVGGYAWPRETWSAAAPPCREREGREQARRVSKTYRERGDVVSKAEQTSRGGEDAPVEGALVVTTRDTPDELVNAGELIAVVCGESHYVSSASMNDRGLGYHKERTVFCQV